ncbi:MAG: thiamine biosynthesis protein [Nitrosopumilus sp.]|nr:thiamine biosynthesis protein [Nitrosopumilus sp.]MDH3501235.1 thiamine biosynthesis protein [Nitrosopumilus sp.]
MNEISYVVVFPNEFSKNKIPQLITNVKKILKIKNQQFNSIKRDGDVILIDANDPVFSSSAINLLFGVEKVAIARQIKNNFQDIVLEITSVGGNLLLKGEKFLVRVEGISKGFFTKDVELSATSSIIEKKSNLDAKPGTEENYDKLLYTYLTKNYAYVCIFLDRGLGGIPYQSQNQNTICSVYDEISAISCFETIKQGFNSKIIVCYRQKSELTNLVKMINQIIPRLVREKIDIEFFHIKNTGSGIKNYLSFVNSVLEIMIYLAKKNKINHVSIALSSLIFAVNFIDNSIKQVFENNLFPITPISGIDSNLFEDAREIGLEKNFPKIKKLILINTDKMVNFSSKNVDDAIKSKRLVSIKVGPNNVHDILDALDENH